MRKHKLGKWNYTDTEIDHQIRDATLEALKASEIEPRAEAAKYDQTQQRITVELSNGSSFSFDPRQFPNLRMPLMRNWQKLRLLLAG
jgi:hypothetical protein